LANVPEGGACVTVRIPMFEVQDGTEDGIKS